MKISPLFVPPLQINDTENVKLVAPVLPVELYVCVFVQVTVSVLSKVITYCSFSNLIALCMFAVLLSAVPISLASFCLICHLSLQAGSFSLGKDRDRWRGSSRENGGFKVSSRRTTSSKPSQPSPSPAPAPPPRPPVRSRRKSKSPSSHHGTSKRALDLDRIGNFSDPEDTRPTRRGSRDPRGSQDSELDRKWEGVALELRCRGSRMRSAVYQTSDLPSMVQAKRHLKQNESKGQVDRSQLKATFV